MKRLDGKIAALTIKEDLKKAFNEGTRKACLAIIRFDDPASESYLKGRLKITKALNKLSAVGSNALYIPTITSIGKFNIKENAG